LLALLLLTTVVWVFLVDRLEARIEESLTTRHVVSLANSFTLSNDELEAARKFRQSLPVRDEGVFAWLDSKGGVFSSNVNGLECREGFYDAWLDVSQETSGTQLTVLAVEQVDPDAHDRFRFLARKRGENCLVFGRSMYEVDALRDSVFGLFLWLVPLCLLPSLLIGLSQSLSLRKRLQGLSDAVNAVSNGDLSARMPVQGDDDIDRLANRANSSFERLQESVNALKQLTSIMAHDLRAPLNRMSIPLEEAIQAN